MSPILIKPSANLIDSADSDRPVEEGLQSDDTPSFALLPASRRLKIKMQGWSARAVGRFLAGAADQRTAILCYHSVHPSHSFALSPRIFESHLAWLAVHCEVIPFDTVLRADPAVGKPRVALAFDDGYRDNHEIVLPLLQKYGLTATFFITTGFIDGDPFVSDRLRREWRATDREVTPMSWTQVLELRDAGMRIGAHTCSHPLLIDLDREEARAELVKSKAVLENRCGIPITDLAYPYGGFRSSVGSRTIQLAAEAGYEHAALVEYRGVQPNDSSLRLPRFISDFDSTDTLRQKVLGWWDIVSLAASRI